MLENTHKSGDSHRSWVPYKYLFWIYPDAIQAHPFSWAKEHMAIFFKRATVQNVALADNGKIGGGGGRKKMWALTVGGSHFLKYLLLKTIWNK